MFRSICCLGKERSNVAIKKKLKPSKSAQPVGDAPWLELHLRALAGIPLCVLCHEALEEQLQRECEGPLRIFFRDVVGQCWTWFLLRWTVYYS